MRATLSRFFESATPPGVLAAFLFGSHARGTANAASDVDIGLLLDRRLLPSRADRATFASQLVVQLIDATHRNDVDVVVLNDAPAELAVTAADAGPPLYAAANADLHVFVRNARLHLADLQPFLQHTRRLKLEAIVR